MNLLNDLIWDRILSKKNLVIIVLLLNVFGFLGIFLYVKHTGEEITKYPVRYTDQIGYYVYLPAIFNYRDLSLNFMFDESYPSVESMTFPNIQVQSEDASVLGYHEIVEGIYADKYPIGTALMMAPFYLLAHVVSIISGLPTDGWSALYQYYCAWGSLNYLYFAFFLLYKLLRKKFEAIPILFGMFFLMFGTNLIHYSTYENLFSHMFSFSVIAYFIWLVDKWHMEKHKPKVAILIGIVAGLIILLRPANLFILIFFVIYNFKGVPDRIKLFIKEYKSLLLIILFGAITILPQLLYWKYAYGQFLVFSYTGESFNFLNPQIYNVLFSTAKGLFFWSPILIFSVVGFFVKFKKNLRLVIPILIILILQTYLISSWGNWEYGESFGHRAFVDIFPFFLFGLVNFLQVIPKKWYILGFALVAVNLIQMVQFWLKIIPPAGTTWHEYTRTFLKFNNEYINLWRIERGWD